MSAQVRCGAKDCEKNNHLQSGYNCGFAGDFMFFRRFAYPNGNKLVFVRLSV